MVCNSTSGNMRDARVTSYDGTTLITWEQTSFVFVLAARFIGIWWLQNEYKLIHLLNFASAGSGTKFIKTWIS